MSETNDPNYRWRPATRGDIGSVARFGDTTSEHEPWTYGILKGIKPNPDDAPKSPNWIYLSDEGNLEDEGETLSFFVCQIQYDANQEP